MIHLYAFVAGLDELPHGLESIERDGIRAVYGQSVGDTHEDVVQHGRVLEALLERAAAVLPVRFGERFETVDALATAVAARSAALQETLATLDGCVELTVRVARADARVAKPVSGGAEYLRARLRVVSEDEALVSSFHGALRSHARAAAVAQRPVSSFLHDASYLVDRDGVSDFAAAVDRYAASYPELAVVCTGPWPPASFAELS